MTCAPRKTTKSEPTVVPGLLHDGRMTLEECQAARVAIRVDNHDDAVRALRMIRGHGACPPPEWRQLGGFVAMNTLNGRFADEVFYREHGFKIIYIDQVKAS